MFSSSLTVRSPPDRLFLSDRVFYSQWDFFSSGGGIPTSGCVPLMARLTNVGSVVRLLFFSFPLSGSCDTHSFPSLPSFPPPTGEQNNILCPRSLFLRTLFETSCGAVEGHPPPLPPHRRGDHYPGFFSPSRFSLLLIPRRFRSGSCPQGPLPPPL